MRTEQKPGARGSQKWIQCAINESWRSLNDPIVKKTGSQGEPNWVSPLAEDGFAEYRDGDFLARIERPELLQELRAFWPSRGPRWDALGTINGNDVLLVEAKAHIKELCSSGTTAGLESRGRIEAALGNLASKLGATAQAPWADCFYQLANRIAFLDFLRSNGVGAWLVLVNFLGDEEMGGPNAVETWEAAYQVAFHVMGLSKEHMLARHIIHVYPDVRHANGASR